MIASPPIETADAAHLDHVGDDDAQAVGTDDPGAALRSQLDHLSDVAARDPLGDDHDQLDAILERLEHRVLGERRWNRDHRAVDLCAVVIDRLRDRVEHGDAVDIAAQAAGRDAAHDLCALAVLKALAGEVDSLAARDALDDEGGVFVDEDRHQTDDLWIFSTARLAASCSETERSAYSTP